MPTTMERRCRRTTRQNQAVGYFLESAALRLGLDVLALADSSGRLLAGSGDLDACLIAARAAPSVFHGEKSTMKNLGARCFVEALFSPRKTYFLMAVGESSPSCLRTSGTLAGIRRILEI